MTTKFVSAEGVVKQIKPASAGAVVPLISVRKQGSADPTSIVLQSLDVVTNNISPLLIEVRKACNVTDGQYALTGLYDSAMEANTACTSARGGVRLFAGLASGPQATTMELFQHMGESAIEEAVTVVASFQGWPEDHGNKVCQAQAVIRWKEVSRKTLLR